jgi:hypothetical protein
MGEYYDQSVDEANLILVVRFQLCIKRSIEKQVNLSPLKSFENMNLMRHRYVSFLNSFFSRKS